MSSLATERVLSVHHWNESLFSFRTTRDPGLRFENGQFVMIGLDVGGKPLTRAYSIASPNYEEHLEFFSIKVPDGPLTSRLQHLRPGDPIVVSKKPTGTLVLHDLKPGKHLYLLATGTGLAPFLSVIQDPETYERFEKVVLVHGVRFVSELAYTVAGSLIPHKSGVVKRRRRVGAGGAVNGTRAARVGPRCAGGRGSIRTTDRRTAARPA